MLYYCKFYPILHLKIVISFYKKQAVMDFFQSNFICHSKVCLMRFEPDKFIFRKIRLII